jgi:hypothetical protein
MYRYAFDVKAVAFFDHRELFAKLFTATREG